MRTLAVATVAAALLCTTVPPASAVHVATGLTCGMATAPDPAAGPAVHVGAVSGGPVAATIAGSTVTIVCTVQVGAANGNHPGLDAAVGVASATQAATLPPTLVSYVGARPGPVFLCTQWVVNGVAYFYDAGWQTFGLAPNVPCAPVPAGMGGTYTALPLVATV